MNAGDFAVALPGLVNAAALAFKGQQQRIDVTLYFVAIAALFLYFPLRWSGAFLSIYLDITIALAAICLYFRGEPRLILSSHRLVLGSLLGVAAVLALVGIQTVALCMLAVSSILAAYSAATRDASVQTELLLFASLSTFSLAFLATSNGWTAGALFLGVTLLALLIFLMLDLRERKWPRG